MTNDDKNIKNEDQAELTNSKRPDDKGNIQIDCHVKIFDPNSQETIMESRA